MITMSAEPTTLMGREEREGTAYPLWIERLLLLIGVACLLYTSPSPRD